MLQVDLSDPQRRSRAAMRNQTKMDEIGQKAHAHAVVVGGFDAASMGMAGKSLLPARIRPANPILGEYRRAYLSKPPYRERLALRVRAGGEVAAGDPLPTGTDHFGVPWGVCWDAA